MENLLSLKKVDDVSYQLFSKINSKLIGNIMIERDGQFYFEPLADGLWSERDLMSVIEHLRNLQDKEPKYILDTDKTSL